MPNQKLIDKHLIQVLAAMILVAIPLLYFAPPDGLDSRLYYTGEQAHQIFSNFDKTTIKSYVITALIDFLFMGVYSYALIISLKRLFPNYKKIIFLAILPGALDFIETSGILYALLTPPPYSFFHWLGMITFSKWAIGLVCFLLVLLGTLIKP